MQLPFFVSGSSLETPGFVHSPECTHQLYFRGNNIGGASQPEMK
jgi:hypothetical protein